MGEGTAPAIDEARFIELVRRNPVIETILARMPALELPDLWLVSACLTMTVWNLEDGHDPTRGIKDYDLFYCDPGDLSWEAEDRAIARAAELFADLGVPVELRNQARVHLWFDKRNGTSGYPQLTSSADGIDRFLQRTTTFGIAPDKGGAIRVYAPYGFDDLSARRIRPNPLALGPKATYDEKAARWKSHFPDLTIEPWETRQAVS